MGGNAGQGFFILSAMQMYEGTLFDVLHRLNASFRALQYDATYVV